MTRPSLSSLSRRERQIMDLLFQKGRATANEVQVGLPDPPSYSAVRALLRILEEKGHVTHAQDGARYVYTPRLDREKAKRSAVRHLVETFFNGSAEQAVAALIDTHGRTLGEHELDRMAELIAKARKEDA
jgi:predicted transcriptional regulator